jgi:hypothetical protein
MSKSGWRLFAVTQFLGVLGIVGFGLLEGSKLGLASWVIALAALFPGDILGSWLVEKLLWPSRVSLRGIQLLSTVCGIAINAVVWLAVARVFRMLNERKDVPAS